MSAFLQFIAALDTRAVRAVGATLALFLAVLGVIVLGRSLLGLEEEAALEAWLRGWSIGPWGLPATVLAFTALACLGAPQFVLIAACVVAFGPWVGFAYSWFATLVSASVTFQLGRWAGADTLARYSGGTAKRFARFVAKNGFWASLIVRLAPTGPFILVNMALGATRATYWGFIAGAALGVIPKIAFVAFAGSGVMALLSAREGGVVAALLGAAAIWLGLMLAGRALLARRLAAQPDPPAGTACKSGRCGAKD
ncbi:MAG: TVP38/TMEM64 family protein [Maricaulaceae bacterium]